MVLRVGRQVFLFEAKHHGLQSDQQWREQVLAARARHPDDDLTVVAVGGWTTPDDRARAERFANLFPEIGLFFIPWDRIREAASVLRSATTAHHEREVLLDIERAVLHWGYRPRVGFDTLPLGTDLSSSTEDVMRNWTVRAVPDETRKLSSAEFGGLIPSAERWRPLADASTLSSWRLA